MFEKVVQAVKSVKISGVASEFEGEVVGLEIFGEFGVARAEIGVGVGGVETAAGAIGETMLATGRLGRDFGIGGLLRCGWFVGDCGLIVHFILVVHVRPRKKFWVYTTRAFVTT